jgi:hypothetical protein
MKKIIILITLISSSISFGQTLDKLDEKNGFKTIKLDDPISIYSSNLKLFKNISEDNVSGYTYTPKDYSLYKVFDTEIDEISLYFTNNTKKLVGITLIKIYSSSDTNHFANSLKDNRAILESFILMFGKFTDKIKKDTSTATEVGAYWDGQKVHLQTSASYFGQSNGSKVIVQIFKQNFLNSKIEEKVKSGF